jgi:hypothetical protein
MIRDKRAHTVNASAAVSALPATASTTSLPATAKSATSTSTTTTSSSSTTTTTTRDGYRIISTTLTPTPACAQYNSTGFLTLVDALAMLRTPDASDVDEDVNTDDEVSMGDVVHMRASPARA